MRVTVSQKVIDHCISERRGFYNPCPIKHVLLEKFPREYVLVNGVGLYADKKCKVPRKVKKFIVDWDNLRPVKPISFRLVEHNNGFFDKIIRMWNNFFIVKYFKMRTARKNACKSLRR